MLLAEKQAEETKIAADA
ncbi:hypothetical protein ACSTJP_00865, partial [Vibrio parahaemolyticus]